MQGLAWINEWGNLRTVTSQAMMGLLHNKLFPEYEQRKTVYTCFARRQMRYILGDNDNGQSYVVSVAGLGRAVCGEGALARAGRGWTAWFGSSSSSSKACKPLPLPPVPRTPPRTPSLTPFPYVQVGVGEKSPCQPHHRGASCGPLNARCDCAAGFSPACNPNTIYGGLVSGPPLDDSFPDVRQSYMQSEVAVDYNAGMTGASLTGIDT